MASWDLRVCRPVTPHRVVQLDPSGRDGARRIGGDQAVMASDNSLVMSIPVSSASARSRFGRR